MKCPHLYPGKRERGSTLVFVVLGSFICLAVAVSLIATRNQAMKLAKRQQLDHLGHLDLTIQTSNLNGQISSMVKQQNGTGVLDTRNAAQFVNQVAGAGGTIEDPTNGVVSPYTVGIGQSFPGFIKALPQYTPLSSSNFKLVAPLTTDPSDPLLGVQSGYPLGIMPVQLYAKPLDSTTVFYPNKTSTLQYTFRQVPMSIYSLYATGNTSVAPGMLTGTGDPGRIYAGQSLTVSGAITASRPIIAQQGVAFSNPSSDSLSVSQSTVSNPALAAAGLTPPAAETLTGAGGATDQAQMSGGNQILTAGMQEKDLQNVPTNNFNDFVNPTGTSPVQLGSQCAFNIGYTASLADKNGNVSGNAQVSLQQGAQVPGPALTALQTGVAQDSNTFNGSWDNFSLNLRKPTGYTAAVKDLTRLKNPAGTAPMQFIVLDYARVTTLLASGSSAPQTFYIQGDPASQAVLLRGGVVLGTTTGTITGGFSLVSNLDVYIYQGIAPATASTNPAISIITPGQVHAAY